MNVQEKHQLLMVKKVDSLQIEAERVIKGWYFGRQNLPMNEHKGGSKLDQEFFREEMSILVGRLEEALLASQGKV